MGGEGFWPAPPARPEDIAAQEWLIGMLANHPMVAPEYLAAVSAEKGCLRVRPEEVGGAGCYKIWPVKFEQAEPASLYILNRI